MPLGPRADPQSLIPHLLEEAHEVVDAIRESHDDDLEGELGDLLLNLSFQVVLGEEREAFTAASVMERLRRKCGTDTHTSSARRERGLGGPEG